MFFKERYIQQGAAEERQAWVDWANRQEKARNAGKPFTDPLPDGKVFNELRPDQRDTNKPRG